LKSLLNKYYTKIELLIILALCSYNINIILDQTRCYNQYEYVNEWHDKEQVLAIYFK